MSTNNLISAAKKALERAHFDDSSKWVEDELRTALTAAEANSIPSALKTLGITADTLFARIQEDLGRGLLNEARAHLNFVDGLTAAEADARQWLPIETAPISASHQEKHYVLAVDAKGRMSVGFALRYSTEEKRLWWTFAKPIGEPTHWMPLPEPPSTAMRKDKLR